MSDTEDYEAIREKNIADRNAFLADFFKDLKSDTDEINRLEKTRLSLAEKENKTPKSVRKRRKSSVRSPTFQGTRASIQIRKKYNTRSKARQSSENEDNNVFDEAYDESVPKKGLKVMFPWSRPMQRDLDLMNMDWSEEENNGESSEEDIFLPKTKRIKRMSRSTYDPSTIPSPDEITEKMLKHIAVKATNKTYDAINGTSCHQCRQKTRDTKTVCRSGECVGVRGQFCGPCLLGRYGESALEALKDPHWACPPCRGLCNCSICRTRNGQRPTGILAPLAKEEGYNSVKDYLQAVDCED